MFFYHTYFTLAIIVGPLKEVGPSNPGHVKGSDNIIDNTLRLG